MTRRLDRALRATAIAALIFALLSVCLCTRVAHARGGTVSIDRNDGVLSTWEVAVLSNGGARWPFAVHVLAGDYGTRERLSQAVHACVNEPDAVCIGLDPSHHRTETHFGTAAGVRPSDFEFVAGAGNRAFAVHDWRGGIEAIADRAAVAARTNASDSLHPRNAGHAQLEPMMIPPPAVTVAAPDSGVHWILWILVALGASFALWFAWRAWRRQRDVEEDMERLREEREEAEARGEEERSWHDQAKAAGLGSTRRQRVASAAIPPAPAASSGSSTNVVVPQSSSGTDSLALGYLLGREDSRPRVVERVRERDSDPPPAWTSRSSDDAGGSASSFDSSPSIDDSPGPSDDDGGSSSSFDSSSSTYESDSGGGGSDFGGGGGFDSGGGGGDF